MSTTNIFPPESMINIEKTIEIKAPTDIVFDAILSGAGMDHAPGGEKLNVKLEAFPGGRWWRDLGNNAGHFWGHVQVIKPPKLLEIVGPMFMSYPVMSHVQYRLAEEKGITVLKLVHKAIGLIPEDHRKNVNTGWQMILEAIRDRAQK